MRERISAVLRRPLCGHLLWQPSLWVWESQMRRSCRGACEALMALGHRAGGEEGGAPPIGGEPLLIPRRPLLHRLRRRCAQQVSGAARRSNSPSSKCLKGPSPRVPWRRRSANQSIMLILRVFLTRPISGSLASDPFIQFRSFPLVARLCPSEHFGPRYKGSGASITPRLVECLLLCRQPRHREQTGPL